MLQPFHHAAAGLHGIRPCTRAYGEMVDLLWKDGNANGAMKLEEMKDAAGVADKNRPPVLRWIS